MQFNLFKTSWKSNGQKWNNPAHRDQSKWVKKLERTQRWIVICWLEMFRDQSNWNVREEFMFYAKSLRIQRHRPYEDDENAIIPNELQR